MEKVTFFYPYKEDLKTFDASLSDPGYWSTRIRSSPKNWLIQTYLRLRDKGLNVHLSNEMPDNGILVAHADNVSLKFLSKNFRSLNPQLLIVTIRADRLEWRPLISDVELLQNGKYANNYDSFFIPYWPQIGLIPRDESRDTEIRNIVFKGGFGSLNADFLKEDWQNYLKTRNLNFIMNTEAENKDYPNWFDYSYADIVLAVRPQFGDGGFRCDKPASKLVNSWHAGVPAILGAEYAFRELKKSELDFIEVTNVSEAIDAVEFLINNPAVYKKMIANGLNRAQQFSSEKLTELWADILFKKIPRVRESKNFIISRGLQSSLRKPYYLISKPQSIFEYRKWLGKSVKSIFKNKKYKNT